MFDVLFQLLFKYRPAVFAKGQLAFGAARGASLGLAVVAVALALGLALVSYRRIERATPGQSRRSTRDQAILTLLRAAALILVLGCLFRPMLLLSAPVPQRNFVAVLVDDSRSMRIAERGGATRKDVVQSALSTTDANSLIAGLRERFQVRLFRFGTQTERVDDATKLTFDANETRITDAIARVRQELDAVPLSGIVVLSDGADNASEAAVSDLGAMHARSAPVFAVGIGAERFDHDVEIERLELPRQVVQGTSFIATVVVRQRGYAGKRVPIVVSDAGQTLAREEVELPANGASTPIRIPVSVSHAGARSLRVEIPVQEGELVAENNGRPALMDVRQRREKILYVEGEPRYEVRFLREAVDADSNLQLVVLQRTAENKYLRLNVDGPSELPTGFPTSRAELFRYRAIIMGSIEASAFSAEQLRMLADFVSVRGGGVLFLGGRRAFGEGGFAGTPLADIYPVFVDGDAVPDSLAPFAELTVRVSPAGAQHPVTQHITKRGASPESSPITRVHVSSVNNATRLKPAAVSLLDGSAGRYRQPVLAYQRFGRGIAVAMPIQDSWLWYMDASVPPDDATYATLWRQLLRWITTDTPNQLRVTSSVAQVRPSGAVSIRAELADSGFVRRNDAHLMAHVRAPSGATRDVPLEWVVDRDGEYQGSFASDERGLHVVRVTVDGKGTAALEDSAYVSVEDPGVEYFGAEMHAPGLKRVADESGGRFYTPATMKTLPEDIALSKRGVTVINEMDLWDMPIVFVMLVALLCAEWAYRRRRGLA